LKQRRRQINSTTDNKEKSSNRFLKLLPAVFIICLLLALTGCFSMPGSAPKARVSSSQLTDSGTDSITPAALQARVMRFADIYAATVAQACDDVTAQTTNSDVCLAVLRWKLGQATSAFTDATGQNSAVNALDMLVLTTMARMVIEEYGVPTYGDVILPLLETQRSLETNAWTLAGGVLTPTQQQELRDLIKEWRAKNPNQHYIGPVRFREFVSDLGKTPTKATTKSGSLFSLLYLDPFAGLDPTAAAIEETRELGERAMYYSQRMPMLLSWQVEVLAYQLAEQPGSKQVLNDANRLAASAEIFAQTAQQLPQLVNDQRQAAIQQVFDGLNSSGDKSRELLADARLTLNAASEAATNINAGIKSLDEFVRYVSPTNAVSTSSSTNSRPFNVLDYGTSAAQIAVAANNLTALLAAINQSTPQLAQISRQTTEDASRVVDHAFKLAVGLILILLSGSVLSALIYQIICKKWPGAAKKELGNHLPSGQSSKGSRLEEE
jgi:hypothetical protein